MITERVRRVFRSGLSRSSSVSVSRSRFQIFSSVSVLPDIAVF